MPSAEWLCVGDLLVRRDRVMEADLSRLAADGSVEVLLEGGRRAVLSGQPALDLVMALRPSALEGRRLRWARGAWAFHNLVAHPALQLLSWAGLARLGMAIHDASVPRPPGRK